MSLKPCLGGVWAENTLERAERVGQQVLERAQSRKIEWPSQRSYSKNPLQDPKVYMSLDDAFATMFQYMSVTSRNCKRYYNTCEGSSQNSADHQHCDRFHTPGYTAKIRKNPLQRSEDVHILVEPGTYAVSAGAWGTAQQMTHVVHVPEGNTVDLDFVL